MPRKIKVRVPTITTRDPGARVPRPTAVPPGRSGGDTPRHSISPRRGHGAAGELLVLGRSGRPAPRPCSRRGAGSRGSSSRNPTASMRRDGRGPGQGLLAAVKRAALIDRRIRRRRCGKPSLCHQSRRFSSSSVLAALFLQDASRSFSSLSCFVLRLEGQSPSSPSPGCSR